MKWNRIKVISFFSCAVLLIVLFREVHHLPDGNTHLSFFDVGQGDAALIRTPSGKHIVIDGGPDLSLLEHLGTHLPFFNRKIDLLVLSHPNLDHMSAFLDILKRYDVKEVLLAKTHYDLPRYEGMLRMIAEKNIPVTFAISGQRISYDDGLMIDVLWPHPEFSTNESNDLSVVLRLHDGIHSALFTGDIEARAEGEILHTGFDLRSDILKVPHHGSRTSSSTGFLLSINPSFAMISVGRENRYGHPHPITLKKYETLSIPVWRTDRQGTMEVVWD